MLDATGGGGKTDVAPTASGPVTGRVRYSPNWITAAFRSTETKIEELVAYSDHRRLDLVPAAADCEFVTEGGCTAAFCRGQASVRNGAQPHAGRLEFLIPGRPTATLSPNPATGRYSETNPLASFSAGQTLRITGAGADVLAFDVDLGAITPVRDGMIAVPSAGSPDLVATWTGGLADHEVKVVVETSDSDAPENVLGIAVCWFPASAGRGAVPAAILNRFRPLLAPMKPYVSVDVATNKRKTITAGSARVEVRGEIGAADRGVELP